MAKFLYIVDHFVPFPQSEFGGVWNVVADSDEQCFDLITDDDNESYPEFYGHLRENIVKADKYQITEDVESKVISSFLTQNFMAPQSTEALLFNLQMEIKHLQEELQSKDKEIENLKSLIFKLQDIKESK